jgi:hypothetical protein
MMTRRYLAWIVLVCFFWTSVLGPDFARAQVLSLPAPGAMVGVTSSYMPVMMKGLKVHPDNALLFDFILDTGKSGLKLDGQEFRAESKKLIKYFLASLTIKEEDMWVNLSPVEKDRVIAEDLGRTELGRDMLAQDYVLKQLTASLIYPEDELGKTFWARVYAQAQEKFGTTDIPVDTFNKVWITGDRAKVLERDNTGYVVGMHLKVMLESDYMATLKANLVGADLVSAHERADIKSAATNDMAKSIIREIVLPAIEKEVNEGANFASLRQIFSSMILAAWYKNALKDALLNQVYADKGKTGGVESDDPAVKEKIYARYLEAYRKGVFNYIKEEADPVTGDTVPRKYFSGGVVPGEILRPAVTNRLAEGDEAEVVGDMAMVTTQIEAGDSDNVELMEKYGAVRVEIDPFPEDVAARERAVIGSINGQMRGKPGLDGIFHYFVEEFDNGKWFVLGYSTEPKDLLDPQLLPSNKRFRFTYFLNTGDPGKNHTNLVAFRYHRVGTRYRYVPTLHDNNGQLRSTSYRYVKGPRNNNTPFAPGPRKKVPGMPVRVPVKYPNFVPGKTIVLAISSERAVADETVGQTLVRKLAEKLGADPEEISVHGQELFDLFEKDHKISFVRGINGQRTKEVLSDVREESWREDKLGYPMRGIGVVSFIGRLKRNIPGEGGTLSGAADKAQRAGASLTPMNSDIVTTFVPKVHLSKSWQEGLPASTRLKKLLAKQLGSSPNETWEFIAPQFKRFEITVSHDNFKEFITNDDGRKLNEFLERSLGSFRGERVTFCGLWTDEAKKQNRGQSRGFSSRRPVDRRFVVRTEVSLPMEAPLEAVSVSFVPDPVVESAPEEVAVQPSEPVLLSMERIRAEYPKFEPGKEVTFFVRPARALPGETIGEVLVRNLAGQLGVERNKVSARAIELFELFQAYEVKIEGWRDNEGKRGSPVIFDVPGEWSRRLELPMSNLVGPDENGFLRFVGKLKSDVPADRTEAIKGGIDLNAGRMDLETAHEGTPMAMALDQALIDQFTRGDLSGVVPVILKITPVQGLIQPLG